MAMARQQNVLPDGFTTIRLEKSKVMFRQWLVVIFLVSLLPSGAGAKVFYVDPQNGSITNDGSAAAPWSTLQAVIEYGLVESFEYSNLPYDGSNPLVPKNVDAPVQAGDTLLLFSGFHGDVQIERYYNADYITVMAADAGQVPLLRRLRVVSARNWRFVGLSVSAEAYGSYESDLVTLVSHNWSGPSDHLTVSGCHIFSTSVPWTSAGDWVNKAGNGIICSARRALIEHNVLENVRFGIILSGDSTTCRYNSITNFSADGMRVVASHLLVAYNTIKNCYDVDDNHDDGMQSFTTGGLVVDYDTIVGNIILNYEDPNQPLLGPLQGIGNFDGFYNHWVVENNLVVVNHWHGISFYGAKDCRIVNNTVLDPTPQVAPGGAWIKVTDSKQGEPSQNCVIKNNVANQFAIDDGVTDHNVVLSTQAAYQMEFVDPAHNDFHLLPGSMLIDAGDPSVAPPLDLDQMPRSSGAAPDIGAYEYQEPSPVAGPAGRVELQVSPNPFHARLSVMMPDGGRYRVRLLDVEGHLIAERSAANGQVAFDALHLPRGLYYVYVFSPGQAQPVAVRLVVKN